MFNLKSLRTAPENIAYPMQMPDSLEEMKTCQNQTSEKCCSIKTCVVCVGNLGSVFKLVTSESFFSLCGSAALELQPGTGLQITLVLLILCSFWLVL